MRGVRDSARVREKREATHEDDETPVTHLCVCVCERGAEQDGMCVCGVRSLCVRRHSVDLVYVVQSSCERAVQT